MDFIIRIGLALILGALIGAEREWRNKLAGLKTNALVCVGSALFTCIGFFAGDSSSNADPTRIAAQIASGIGFLGAGAILRDGLTIRGLTTAATVWCAAAVGTMAGAGLLMHSVLGTCFIFGCNMVLKEITHVIFKHHNVDAPVEHYVFNFQTPTFEHASRKAVLNFFAQQAMTIHSLDIQPTRHGFSWNLIVQSSGEEGRITNPEDLSDKFWEIFAVPLNWKLG